MESSIGPRRHKPIPRAVHSARAKSTSSSPHTCPHCSRGEVVTLGAIYRELRELRVSLSEIQTWAKNMVSSSSRRAVSIDNAQAILGCGRSRVYELLRSGALRRAPKVGKQAMISLTSLEAFLDTLHREPASKLKRRPAQRGTSREAEEILKLIRQ